MVRPIASSSRRLWWRRFIERQTLIRHPVSLTRQRFDAALLILLIAGLAWYGLNTRDEAIRRRAVEFLCQATSGEVSVERAQFQMFDGITLYGVRVSVPYNPDFDPAAVEARSRDIFSATSLKLIHNPWRLLLGHLRVDQVVAVRPQIILAHNVDTGLRNWQLLATGGERPSGSAKLGYRPNITVRSASAEVVSIHADGRRDSRRVELDADIRPHRQIRSAYSIEVRRFTDPAERTTVVFDPGARLVTNTPFVDAQTVRLQLPKPVQEFFDRISLRGEVKISRLVYDAQSPEERDTAIEVRDVRCSVPLLLLGNGSGDEAPADGLSQTARSPATAPDREGAPAGSDEDYAVVVHDVQGSFELRGDVLAVDVSGVINQAKVSLVGRLENVGASLDQIGLDVQVRGIGVRAPDGPLRRRAQDHPSLPWELKAFLQDYDPHGPFDVDFHVVRPAGASSGFGLSGTLRPQGARASCRWFPYTVEDLRGVVRFDAPCIFLENLEGRHGPAIIQVNGKIDRRTWWSSLDVHITGESVALDADLFEPLSEQHQSLWRRFDPRGSADLSVRIQRPGADRDDPWPSWRTTVSAELEDAQMCLREYPYPLERVSGRVEIQPNRLQFRALTGHRGAGSVRVDGFAMFAPSEDPTMELRIEAAGLKLDETFAAALPPEAREAFAQFQPEGFVDLLGTLSLQDPQRGLVYDLRATLHQAALCYRHFPYRVSGVSAEVAIRPTDISIINVTGAHGPAELSASGSIRRTAAGFVADLSFDGGDLLLDQDLYAALPEALKEVWHLLEPSGKVQVLTKLHYVSEDGQVWTRHRTEIEATDGALRFAGFPIDLTSVTAQVRASDRRVEILSMQGRAGGGLVRLSGTIDLNAAGREGTFTLDAAGLVFTEELVAVTPPALRQVLEAVKPNGRFDLRLDHLQVKTDPEGQTRWDFDGELTLTEAQGDLGFLVRDLTGSVSGRGAVLADGGIELNARVNLTQAVLGGWHLENVKAHLVSDSATRALYVEDFSAAAYGGEAVGFAEVEFMPGGPAYQLSATARELQLDRYMQVHHLGRRGRASDPVAARGSVYGNLVMRGRAGKHGQREAAGEVFVREAQVCHLPIMLAVFRVLNLAPDENAFHDGWLKFSLLGDELTFQRIDLQGSALSFVGGGKMNLRDRRLEVILLAGSPLRLRVPILTELLEGASRDLMEVRVTGTPEDPRITPQSLENLSEVLKALFPEPPRKPATEGR